LLVYAAQLVSRGIHPHIACEVSMCSPITDDKELQRGIREIITTVI
jgi:CbbQ/NirQ/NorQ-like protein